MRSLIPHFESARRLVRAGGPYLLLELLLPGGTLFALLLFLYRRKGSRLAALVDRMASAGGGRVVRNMTEQIMLPLDMYAWARRIETGCERPADGLDAFDIAPAWASGCGPSKTPSAPAARRRVCVTERTGCYPRSEVIAVH